MRSVLASLAMLALAACAGTVDRPSAPAPPDIAHCNAQHAVADDYPMPADPVAIPAGFRPFVAGSRLELAVATGSGQTLCLNTQGYYAVTAMEWLQGQRLLGWEWEAYEAFGYQLVDRHGAGQMVETGARPAMSPSGRRMASVQISESQFGRLEGFAVWDLTDDGLIPQARHGWSESGEPPVFLGEIGADWHIGQWSGEHCVDLTSTPWNADTQDYDRTAAQPFHAAQADGWRVTPGACR